MKSVIHSFNQSNSETPINQYLSHNLKFKITKEKCLGIYDLFQTEPIKNISKFNSIEIIICLNFHRTV